MHRDGHFPKQYGIRKVVGLSQVIIEHHSNVHVHNDITHYINLQNSYLYKSGGYCSHLDPSSSSYRECLDISISLSASFTSSRSTTSARRSRAWREEQERGRRGKSVDRRVKTDKRESGREEKSKRGEGTKGWGRGKERNKGGETM